MKPDRGSNKRTTPFVRRIDDPFWLFVKSVIPEAMRVDNAFYLMKEGSLASADMIQPTSVARFKIERGDFLYSNIVFKGVSQPPPCWGNWVDEVCKNKVFEACLRNVGIYSPIRISKTLIVRPSLKDLEFLIAHWSIESHTFIFPWGEIGPTLEDVNMLMCLDIRGDKTFIPGTQTLSGKISFAHVTDAYKRSCCAVSQYLKEGDLQESFSKPNSDTSWNFINYFFKEFAPKPHQNDVPSHILGPEFESETFLHVFISFWLSIFILPSSLHDGVNPYVFHLAVALADGHKVPLAPLFLGNLFHWLDMAHEGYKNSNGNSKIPCYAQTQFLMAFLFERFPSFAPIPNSLLAMKKSHLIDVIGSPIHDDDANLGLEISPNFVPRIMRWHDKGTTKSLIDCFDKIEEFVCRPYSAPIPGVRFPPYYTKENLIVSEPFPANLCDVAYNWMAISLPSFLPVLTEEMVGSTVYRPDRVSRQLGYDQGIPVHAPERHEYLDCMNRFLTCHSSMLRTGMSSFSIPSIARVGSLTANQRLYWRRNLDAFASYLQGMPDALLVQDVPHSGITLNLTTKDLYERFSSKYANTSKENILTPIREKSEVQTGTVTITASSSSSGCYSTSTGSTRRSCRIADKIYPNWYSFANGVMDEVEDSKKARKTRSVRRCKSSPKTSNVACLMDEAELDKEVEKNEESDKDENQMIPNRKRKVRKDEGSSKKSKGRQNHLLIYDEKDFERLEFQPEEFNQEAQVEEENTRHLEIAEKEIAPGEGKSVVEHLPDVSDKSKDEEVIHFDTPVVTAIAAQATCIRNERPSQGIQLAGGAPQCSSERAMTELSQPSGSLSDPHKDFELILGCPLDKKAVNILRPILAAHPETFKCIDLEGDRIRRAIFHSFADFIVEYEYTQIDSLDLNGVSLVLRDIEGFEQQGFNLGWARIRVESVRSIKEATAELSSIKVAMQEISLKKEEIEAMKVELALMEAENAKEMVILEETEARVSASLPKDVHGDDFFWKGLF